MHSDTSSRRQFLQQAGAAMVALGSPTILHATDKAGTKRPFVGSGGLSHDPPTPRLEQSPPDVARRLIVRHTPTQDELDARESRVIKYIGSKRALAPEIERLARRLPIRSVADLFAGTTRAGQAFRRAGCRASSW